MKIPLQEKIAELETRIAALEKLNSVTFVRSNREFDSHWRNMWKEFDLALKAMFK